MAGRQRARWSARFAPLVILFVVAAMFFSAALGSAKPKDEAGKSKSAPGQAKKDTSEQSGGGASGSEKAKPAKEKPAKAPAAGKSSKPSKPSSGGGGNGSSGGVKGTQGSGGGSKKGSGGGSTQGSGGSKNPPGNNGTIKIDDSPFDTHPNNEPHVGCIFQIDLYGYDENDEYYADYSFVLHSPTLSPSGANDLKSGSVFIGEDAAGGGTDLDAEVTIDLSEALAASGATPHSKQGYHVKLTVHADGSQGADTKHKVFWVQGCGSTTSSAPPASSQPPGGSQIVSQPPGSSQPPTSSQPPGSEVPSPSVGGSQLFSTPPSGEAPPPSQGTTILGRRITTGPSSVLPFTGGTVSTLLILAGMLVAAGGAILLGSRKYGKADSAS